jgi:hypothetical protein
VCGDGVRAFVQTIGVETANRIPSDVCIGRIAPAGKPDRIAFDITPNRRVILSEVVLMQSGLAVENLAWKPQVVGEARCYEPPAPFEINPATSIRRRKNTGIHRTRI